MLRWGTCFIRSSVKLIAAALMLLSGTVCVGAGASTIVVLGDSLSSGHGLPIGQSWVSRLEERLTAEGYGYAVVNASIPGDTSSGGLARLPGLLESHEPRIVIIELGGNDGLRGQPVASLRANLARMIELTREAGAEAILTGIQIPPNYGPTYTSAFASVYPELAEALGVPLVGFLMQDVALDREFMQTDGLHPNERGNDVMLENVWAVLVDLL